MKEPGKFLARGASLLAVSLVASLAVSGVADGAARYDRSFGVGGIKMVRESLAGGFFDVTMGGNGKLLATGWRSIKRCGREPVVVRFHANGRVDRSYGGTGVAPGSERCLGIGQKIVVGPGGTTVLVSRSDPPFGLAHPGIFAYRLDSGGNLSKTWGSKNRPGRAFAGVLRDEDLTSTRRGKTLISGNVTRKSFGTIVRLDRNGRRDRTLTGDERTRTDLRGVIQLGEKGGVEIKIYALKALGSGKFLAAATIDQKMVALGFTSSGALDGSFGTGGIARIPAGRQGADRTVFADLALDHHGRIVLAGFVKTKPPRGRKVRRTQVVKLSRDGRVLDTFGNHGITRLEHVELSDAVVQRDGSIVIRGFNRLVRLTPSGKLDKSFFRGGYFSQPEDVRDLDVDRAGRLLEAGSFYGKDGIYGHAGLARILPR